MSALRVLDYASPNTPILEENRTRALALIFWERRDSRWVYSTPLSGFRSLQMRFVRWIALVCAVLVIAYGVSPYFSFWRFTIAVRSGDSAEIISRVDFP